MTDRQAFDTIAELYDMRCVNDLNGRESEIVRILIDKGFLVYNSDNDTVKRGLT
jgi:hypothetical protein